MKPKEWINAYLIKPEVAKGFLTLSVKVDVKTLHGNGTGYYNSADDDWLVELNGKIDELQAYKGVTHWKYIKK
jgi:hypothetical protein